MISKSAFKVIVFSAVLTHQGVAASVDVLEDVAKAEIALENALKGGVAKVKEAGSKVVSANIIKYINIKKAELDRRLAQARAEAVRDFHARAKSAEMGKKRAKERAAELRALGKRVKDINIKKAELDRRIAQASAELVRDFHARAKSAEMGKKRAKERAAELSALGQRAEGALAKDVSRFYEAARKTPAEIKKAMSDIDNSVAKNIKIRQRGPMKSAPGKMANKIKKRGVSMVK